MVTDEPKIGAIWARVSTTGQHETSIPSQIERCKSKAQSMGYVIPTAFILSTDKSSLQLNDDPAFLELYGLIVKKKITAIFLLDRDRLQAEPLERLSFISLCRENGVTIYPLQGPELLDSDEGVILEHVLAIGKKNAVLRAQLGSKQGLHDRVTIFGKPVTFRTAYGYDWKGETKLEKEKELALIPNENWPNVKLVFDLLLSGMGYEHIIKELHSRGIPSPSGQMIWNKTALSNLIHNPLYAGRYYGLKKEAVVPKSKPDSKVKSTLVYRNQNDWVYLDKVKIENPPITWDQRQKILDQVVSHMKLSKRHAKNDYLLRGFVFCNEHYGVNGRPRVYHGHPKPDRNTFYYVCPITGCKNRYIPGPELDMHIKIRIAMLIGTQPDKYYDFLDNQTKGKTKAHIQKQLDVLKSKSENRIVLLKLRLRLNAVFILILTNQTVVTVAYLTLTSHFVSAITTLTFTGMFLPFTKDNSMS